MPMVVTNGGAPTKELTKYLKRINELNNFDLAWRWFGNSDIPEIEVYEEAEQHVLCIDRPDNIMHSVKYSLRQWGLDDPDK